MKLLILVAGILGMVSGCENAAGDDNCKTVAALPGGCEMSYSLQACAKECGGCPLGSYKSYLTFSLFGWVTVVSTVCLLLCYQLLRKMGKVYLVAFLSFLFLTTMANMV